MNKIGSLESQLMDAFKEKEEKEVVTTAADAKKLQEKEVAKHTLLRVAMHHRQKFNSTWRKKNKKRKKTAKISRKNNR